MTEEPRKTRDLILLMIRAILAFGAPSTVLLLNGARVASPSTRFLPAILLFVVAAIMIYFSEKRIGMGDQSARREEILDIMQTKSQS